MIRPAIAVVAYNRLDSVQRLLASIQRADYTHYEDIPLIISIDHADDNAELIAYAQSFRWTHGEKFVKTHDRNLGLRAHILECGDYADEFGGVILLEDDLMVAKDFYNYAYQALNCYERDEKVAGIALYCYEWNGYAFSDFHPLNNGYDVFFGQFGVSWGQAWTKNQWQQFRAYVDASPSLKPDKHIPSRVRRWKHSWLKFFIYYMQEQKKYYVVPYQPLTTCFGDAGVHNKTGDTRNQVAVYQGIQHTYRFPAFEDGKHYDAFFESIDLKAGFHLDGELCVDLYGVQKRNYRLYDYVLTPVLLDRKIIKKYGLLMRPAELNIQEEVAGEGIFLYQMNETGRNSFAYRFNRLDYEYSKKKWNLCLAYGIKRFVWLCVNKLRKIMHGKW